MNERLQTAPDDALVRAALAGQFTAFDVLVRRYRTAVLAAISRRVASRSAAEEICQETFLRAFNAMHTLRDPSRFAAWLHAIARREVIRRGEAAAREAHLPLDEVSLSGQIEPAPSAWDAVARREDRDEVRAGVAALPEEFHLVLVLHYWHEMPLEPIAAFIGRPVSTVKWRLHRARALLRARLMVGRADMIRDTGRNDDEPEKRRSHSRPEATGEPAGKDGVDGRTDQPDGGDGGRRRRRPPHLQQRGQVSPGPG